MWLYYLNRSGGLWWRVTHWQKLLKHRYGDFAVVFVHGSPAAISRGSKGSTWWRDLIILDRLHNPEGRFSACIRRKLGNGRLVDFWNDQWLGNAPLSSVFPNFYAGCELQSATMADMGDWTGDI